MNLTSVSYKRYCVYSPRDPINLFMSLWDYSKLGDVYGMPLERYALADKSGRLADRKRVKLRLVGRNQMLFDFGLEPRHFDDEEAVRRKILEIDEAFDMVLMADRFEESVALLREALCWTHEDVSYLKLNARQGGKKTPPLSAAARRALRHWLRADFMLYDHFRNKFDGLVAGKGGRWMRRETEILSATNKIVRDKCVIEEMEYAKLPKIYRVVQQNLH